MSVCVLRVRAARASYLKAPGTLEKIGGWKDASSGEKNGCKSGTRCFIQTLG